MAASADIELAVPEPSLGRARARPLARRGALHVALILCGVPFLVPFYWLVSTSFKPDEQLFATPTVWIPTSLTLDHYSSALSDIPFWQYLGNTAYITIFAVVATLVSCTLVAYSLACIDWPGRNLLFVITLATLMIPYPVTIVPTFIIFKWLHWIGTFNPLTWPNFTGNPFFIFLLRQFFLTIPAELSESARIDGASEFHIFWRIVLPLARPALVTTALFTFLGNWNDLLNPLIYLTDPSTFTLALGLTSFVGGHGGEWGALMAAGAMMTLPVIVLFFIAQRAFIEGITLTGIKE
jgi:multiple sugar transport system permease protein